MKSEHRHQLHTNELAKWLSEVPEMLKRNKKMVIYVLVVAILVIVSAYMTIYRTKGQQRQYRSMVTYGIQEEVAAKYQIAQAMAQGGDSSMALSIAASTLVANAQELDNDKLKGLAYIKAGDMLRAELQFKPGLPERVMVESQIQTAENYYQQAIKVAGEDENLLSMAKYGIGLCKEELGNFDQAVEIYTEIATNTEYAASPAYFQAQRRLSNLVDYTGEVEFLPAPVVEPPQASEEMTPDIDQGSILEGLNITPDEANQQEAAPAAGEDANVSQF